MATVDKTKIRGKVLKLTLEGRWTQSEMAEAVGVSTRTIERLMADKGFRAELDMLRADFTARLAETVYADKMQRIVGLSQMAESARREYERCPLLQEIRPTRDGNIINESFNRDAHAAFRGALDDIAKELGERKSDNAVIQQPVMRRYILEPRT